MDAKPTSTPQGILRTMLNLWATVHESNNEYAKTIFLKNHPVLDPLCFTLQFLHDPSPQHPNVALARIAWLESYGKKNAKGGFVIPQWMIQSAKMNAGQARLLASKIGVET
ncbi:hypothetical protein J4219_04860 [Candidatus Woesearchaeota archaeon]|nr:hypothetical protein [Candidatus Woesearchaeota archaeon]